MESLLYLLKVNVAIAIFYSMYKLFYGNDTFFTMRRYLMQSMLILAVSYPFLDFSQWMVQNQTLTDMAVSYTNLLPEIIIPSSGEIIIPESGKSFPASFSIITCLLWAYLLITGLLLLRLLFRIGFIVRIRLHSQTVCIENMHVLHACKKITPFSFFTWIFINPDIHNEKELHEILMHERVHARQYHSIDILMSECICAFCWINPMAWKLRKEIKKNLEFIVDHHVVEKDDIDRKSYQYHLLKAACHPYYNSITNPFNVSPLKERIMMLNVKKSSRMKLIAYTLVIPLILLFLIVNNAGAVVNKIKEKESVRNVVVKVSEALTFTEVPKPEQRFGASIKHNAKPATVPEQKSGISIKRNAKPASVPEQKMENDQKQISGNIIDKNTKEPLQGVNIIIKDTHNGTFSDAEGHFSIKANKGEHLVLSFVGYATVILNVSDLQEDAGMIEMARKSVELNCIYATGTYTTCKDNLPLKKYLRKNTDTTDNENNEELAFVTVEKMPEFPGGESALLRYIAKHIYYPENIAKKDIQGTILCKFVVKEDGRVGNVKVLKGVDPDLDDEAIRVLYSLPKWKPGEQRGKNVAVEYTLPVVFEKK